MKFHSLQYVCNLSCYWMSILPGNGEKQDFGNKNFFHFLWKCNCKLFPANCLPVLSCCSHNSPAPLVFAVFFSSWISLQQFHCKCTFKKNICGNWNKSFKLVLVLNPSGLKHIRTVESSVTCVLQVCDLHFVWCYMSCRQDVWELFKLGHFKMRASKSTGF